MMLEYQVPRLGTLKAELYPSALMAYQVFEKSGHINRLRENPQLGIIRGVSEGAHHTRWEYVVTQLFLINKFAVEGPERTGLSRSKPKILGNEISGADILQTWVLLLNAGHLLGTFSSEQALLSAFLKDGELKRAFISGLPKDKEIKDFFSQTLINQDMYRIHELLSYFFLYRLRRGNKEEIASLIHLLKLYRFEPVRNAERFRKLKNHFQQIRQIAYLFLDSNYSPVPMTFDLNSILFDFENYANELFSDDVGPLRRSLTSIENLLNDTLYLAPKSMYALGQQSFFIEKQIKSKNKCKKTIGGLNTFLKDSLNLKINIWPIEDNCLLRLWIDLRGNYIPAIQQIKPLSLQYKWNKRLPLTLCKCAVVTDPSRSVMGITLAFNENLDDNKKPKLFSEILRLFIGLQDEFYQIRNNKKGYFPPDFLMPSCKALLLYILEQLWGKNVNFLHNTHSIYPDFWLVGRGATKSSKNLVNISDYFEKSGMPSDRLHEVKTLSLALRHTNHRGVVLMTTGQIIVRDSENNKDLTDIDGVAICADSKELSLILVESKNKKKGARASAKKRIKDTLKAIGFTEEEQPGIINIPGYGAYTRIFLYLSNLIDSSCNLAMLES